MLVLVLVQQTSSSSVWHAAPSNELSRATSVPDNFGSSTSRQAVQQAGAMPHMFTVTTGDIVMRMAPDGETSASDPPVSNLLVHNLGVTVVPVSD